MAFKAYIIARGTTRSPTVAASTRFDIGRYRLTTASSAENLLKAVAAEVGLGRAIGILEGERERGRESRR
jgi:hypothetical protein